MKKEAIRAAKAPAAIGPYSHAVKAGGFIFVAGQGPLDPATGKLDGTDITTQTRRTLENIKAIVEAAGATLDDVATQTG